jgi:O-antigen ligase
MPQTKAPWAVFLFLLAVFAAASFDPFESVDYVSRRDKSVEVRLEESIQRTEAGNVQRRIALCLLGGFSVAILMQQSRNRVGMKGALGFLILFFLVWASASTLWSYDAGLTFRRIVILGFLCLGALAMARRFSFRDIILFTFLAGCVTIVAGLACEFALGTFQPGDPEYRFAGFMNPIFQGAHSGMTVIAALALAHTSRRARAFWLLAALAAFLTMLLTRSRGPAGATLVAAVLYGCLMFPRFRTAAAFLLVGLAIVFAFPSLRNGLLARGEDAVLLGREVERGYEMQGRDALWKECLKFSAQRPMSGYGYDAFWTRDLTFAVTDASGFTSQHTHNAFLDLLLGTGIPGAVTHVLIVILGMRILFSLWRDAKSADYASCLALLVLYAIHNLFVSVHLAVQLQTFIVLVILAKLGFIYEPSSVQPIETVPANGEANHQRQHMRL